jgi:hypothetical protein
MYIHCYSAGKMTKNCSDEIGAIKIVRHGEFIIKLIDNIYYNYLVCTPVYLHISWICSSDSPEPGS